MEGSDSTLAIVEKEENLSHLFSNWLDDYFADIRRYEGLDSCRDFRDDLEEDEVDPDVVILNNSTPKVSGKEVLEYLNNNDYELEVIGTTVYPEKKDDLVEACEIDRCLTKPINREDLQNAVEQLEEEYGQSYEEKVSEFAEESFEDEYTELRPLI